MENKEKTIGMIGGGQLGRMFVEAAHKEGYKVIVLDPSKDCCAGKIADELVVAQYSDIDALKKIARKVSVITYEFENVDAKVLQKIEKEGIKIHPNPRALKITQNRIREKEFVKKIGINVTPFWRITNNEELEEAIEKIGLPSVIKTADGGYDGKGQRVVFTKEEAQRVVNEFLKNNNELIFEKMIELEKEISVICAQNEKGQMSTYPVFENVHKDNILFTTICPAKINEKQEKKAREYAQKIGKELKIIGTYCVEMFIDKKGEILVNEIAPRPHNSGHLTIEATNCSQFEAQLRAVCNLEMKEIRLVKNAAMINILGESKGNIIKGAEKLKNETYLHLYDKGEAKNKRKMGHITILGENALEKAIKARNEIYWSES